MRNPFFVVTDGYGGRGGIAQYNRHLIKAVSEIKNIQSVTVMQRKIFYNLESQPKKVRLIKNVENSKIKFIFRILSYLFKKKNYDAIFCCHIHLLPFAWILGKKFNCPIILTIFGEEAWNPTKHKIANFLSREISYLITIRHYTAKKFLNWSKTKINNFYYIPNCVDYKISKNNISNLKLIKKFKLKNKKIIISCGRMDIEDKNKGMDEIIEILNDLSKKINNVFYIIIGDGDDKRRLELKAKKLKVDHLILFLGNISEKKKKHIYSLGHVMAMPGSRRSFDRYPYRFVNLEGLASGMHVLCSKLNYKSDLMDKDINMFTQVNPNNKKEILNKLIYLLKSKKNNYNLSNLNFSNFKKKVENFIIDTNKF